MELTDTSRFMTRLLHNPTYRKAKTFYDFVVTD